MSRTLGLTHLSPAFVVPAALLCRLQKRSQERQKIICNARSSQSISLFFTSSHSPTPSSGACVLHAIAIHHHKVNLNQLSACCSVCHENTSTCRHQKQDQMVHVHRLCSSAVRRRWPHCTFISRTFSVNEQYFSLTINQLTVLSIMAYQLSEQGTCSCVQAHKGITGDLI